MFWETFGFLGIFVFEGQAVGHFFSEPFWKDFCDVGGLFVGRGLRTLFCGNIFGNNFWRPRWLVGGVPGYKLCLSHKGANYIELIITICFMNI